MWLATVGLTIDSYRLYLSINIPGGEYESFSLAEGVRMASMIMVYQGGGIVG